MPIPAEVFISHSSKDASHVRRIVDVFDRHGVPNWWSDRAILGAQQWHDEIGRALARCDWFVVLLSVNAVASKWVKREVVYALRSERRRRGWQLRSCWVESFLP